MANIRVRNLATGQTGTMPQENFDPNRYSMIGGEGGVVPQQGMVSQPQMSGGGGGGFGGGDMSGILQQLMFASQVAGKRPSVSNVLSLLTPTAGDEEREKENKFTAQLKQGADEIAQAWTSLNPFEKFLPFSGKFAPDRAAAESMKRTHALQTINFLSGKQFSDRERKFVLGLYPTATDTDAVVRAKMNELKNFLDRYSGKTASPELSSSFRPL